MRVLKQLFDNNRAWAQSIKTRDPEFFLKLSQQQAPKYLWIGCSDSRVPANEIIGLMPGEVFVHRNVANVVAHTDLNCLSVLQFAIDVLKIRHVIVCGHYDCGGIRAVIQGQRIGLADEWLHHVREVAGKHSVGLSALDSVPRRCERLCEWNVIEQVRNVCQTSVVQAAWEREQPLTVHGWIYAVKDGLLRDLNVCASSPAEAAAAYKLAFHEPGPSHT